jgi:hypothetical protein
MGRATAIGDEHRLDLGESLGEADVLVERTAAQRLHRAPVLLVYL